MLKRLELHAGPTPGADGLELELSPVTVFVGPNNSGKSLSLREIEGYCRSGHVSTLKVFKKLTLSDKLPTYEDFVDAFALSVPPPDTPAGQIAIQSALGRTHVHVEGLQESIKNLPASLQYYCQAMLTHYVARLDGRGRIDLCQPASAGDLLQPPGNKLAELFRDDDRRAQLRKIVLDAVGAHLVVDPTNLGTLRLRLSDRAPQNELEERGLHAEAVKFHAEALDIEEASDGLKAFIGILLELFTGSRKLLMIDEPEAFLHPSLARKLGQEISLAAQSEEKTVVISTHSPAFLMGCVESHVPVNIVRLTYDHKIASARLLDSSKLMHLMRNPLLRSTNVLDAVFYQNVVVTESDADKAFYQQINERLLRSSPPAGLPNSLFINAQNKTTTTTIAGPLRSLGIPVAVIVDIDVLKCKGNEWNKFLASCAFPGLIQQSLSTARGAIEKAMIATNKDMKREGGIKLLSGGDLKAAKVFIRDMARYGLFIVPGGELESWLRHLNISGHGPNWLIKMFERMGEDPGSADYIKPDSGDVWEFVRQIQTWAADPNREGIPDA